MILMHDVEAKNHPTRSGAMHYPNYTLVIYQHLQVNHFVSLVPTAYILAQVCISIGI